MSLGISWENSSCHDCIYTFIVLCYICSLISRGNVIQFDFFSSLSYHDIISCISSSYSYICGGVRFAIQILYGLSARS